MEIKDQQVMRNRWSINNVSLLIILLLNIITTSALGGFKDGLVGFIISLVVAIGIIYLIAFAITWFVSLLYFRYKQEKMPHFTSAVSVLALVVNVLGFIGITGNL